MSASGDMTFLMTFDKPTSAADGLGGTESGWAEQFTAWAEVRFLRGGETVQAARLTGRQPAVVTIRDSAAAREITADWRMRDARAGTVYNVRTIVPSDDRATLELTCESGVAP